MSSIAEVARTWSRDLLLNRVAASSLVPRPVRWRLLAALGLDVAPSAISAGGHYGGRRISIGPEAFLNYGVFLDNTAEIRIGRRTQLGPEVMILTGTHHLGESTARAGSPYGEPVSIGDGVWIGARATILPGVRVGNGCVIAAGAVVVSDCEPDTVYAGVPAQRLRSLVEA